MSDTMISEIFLTHTKRTHKQSISGQAVSSSHLHLPFWDAFLFAKQSSILFGRFNTLVGFKMAWPFQNLTDQSDLSE